MFVSREPRRCFRSCISRAYASSLELPAVDTETLLYQPASNLLLRICVTLSTASANLRYSINCIYESVLSTAVVNLRLSIAASQCGPVPVSTYTKTKPKGLEIFCTAASERGPMPLSHPFLRGSSAEHPKFPKFLSPLTNQRL